MTQPLSSIAERSPASGGEDSDEEEEDVDGTGWRIGRDVLTAGSGVPRADLVLKSGYLSKKGARRKVRVCVVSLFCSPGRLLTFCFYFIMVSSEFEFWILIYKYF